jgi:hypothetical protein
VANPLLLRKTCGQTSERYARFSRAAISKVRDQLITIRRNALALVNLVSIVMPR